MLGRRQSSVGASTAHQQQQQPVNVAPRALYSFPELKNAEILQCMDDLRIPLQEAELSKPTPQIVQRVLEALSEVLINQHGASNQSQQSQRIADTLEHPDLHVDAISLVAFYRSMVRLMNCVGVDDFSLRDLIRPEMPRLRLLLSAVINFAKFREEQLVLFEEHSRRAEEANEQKIRLQRRRDELDAKLTRVRNKQASEEDAVQALKGQINSMVQTLRELKREQSALSADLDNLKAQKTAGSERLAETNFLVGNLRQDCARIRTRIVQSPEKLQQLIAEMSAGQAAERVAIAAVERKSRSLQMKSDALGALENELQLLTTRMSALHADLNRRSELFANSRLQRESHARLDLQLKELDIRHAQLDRQIAAAQEKGSRLFKHQDERRSKMASRLAALQEQYAGVAEERTKTAARVEQNERAIKDAENRIAETRRAHEAEIVALRADCMALKTRVLSYAAEMKKSLSKSSATMPSDH